jgi:hypothetical protein
MPDVPVTVSVDVETSVEPCVVHDAAVRRRPVAELARPSVQVPTAARR